MIRKSIVLTFAILLISAMTAMACGDNASKTSAQRSGCGTTGKTGQTAQMINTESPAQVTLTGSLTCSNCSLKADGANAACSEHGCLTALKTADGRYITLMQNKFSQNLLANREYKNKPIEISGTFFANANVLDVKSYSVDGGTEVSWCGHCKGMDGCAAKASGSL
jgi:hypothetical protein